MGDDYSKWSNEGKLKKLCQFKPGKLTQYPVSIRLKECLKRVSTVNKTVPYENEEKKQDKDLKISDYITTFLETKYCFSVN